MTIVYSHEYHKGLAQATTVVFCVHLQLTQDFSIASAKTVVCQASLTWLMLHFRCQGHTNAVILADLDEVACDGILRWL